jgi:hypothetical protein
VTRNILTRARELLAPERSWSPHWVGSVADGTYRRTLTAAVMDAAESLGGRASGPERYACVALLDELRPTLREWERAPERSREDVLALLDEAIEAAGRRAA